MLFAFVLSLIPLLVVADVSASSVKGKVISNFKPESWMLKPLSADHKHYKPSAVSVSTVGDYTYWLTLAYYSTTGMYCNTDDVIMKTAIPSYYCIQSGQSSSYMFQCYSDYNCYYYEYQDAHCGIYQTSSYVNLYICQAGDADDDGYVTDDGNLYTSKQLIVQQGYPVPLPGNSTTLTYYDSIYCDPSTMSNYRLGYPNHCYNNYDGENRTSTQYMNPTLYHYNANGCEEVNIDATEAYPPDVCKVDYTTSTSSMLVLNYPVVPTVPLDLGTILGTTAAAFSTMAIANTLLYFFQPALSQATQSSNMQTEKSSEF